MVVITGENDVTALRGTELLQVIIPCVAVPVLVIILLLVIRMCRRRRSSPDRLPTKLSQAIRRQHGAPPVTANNAVGLSFLVNKWATYREGAAFEWHTEPRSVQYVDKELADSCRM